MSAVSRPESRFGARVTSSSRSFGKLPLIALSSDRDTAIPDFEFGNAKKLRMLTSTQLSMLMKAIRLSKAESPSMWE